MQPRVMFAMQVYKHKGVNISHASCCIQPGARMQHVGVVGSAVYMSFIIPVPWYSSFSVPSIYKQVHGTRTSLSLYIYF